MDIKTNVQIVKSDISDVIKNNFDKMVAQLT